MDESEFIERFICALKTVPPKQLKIIDLANRYMKDGELDHMALRDAEPEVDLAIAEAKSYGSYTLQAVDRLRCLEAVPENV